MPSRLAALLALALVSTACGGWYNPFAGVSLWLSIGLLVANLVITYDVVQSRRSVGMKVVWIGIVFLIPILGILAYLMFDRK